MGLLSAVAGGALGAVGGTALDIWKMREGERLRWKYQEKYLDNVQTHARETREDEQAHESGERVAGQDFVAGENRLNRIFQDTQASKGMLFQAGESKKQRQFLANQQDDAQGFTQFLTKLQHRQRTRFMKDEYKEKGTLQDDAYWHQNENMLNEYGQKGLLQAAELEHDRTQRRKDRKHGLFMQTNDQGFQLYRDEELSKDRIDEASHNFELRRKENRQRFRQERKLLEDRYHWEFKIWKKQNKWTADNMPEMPAEVFTFSPNDEKILLEGFKEFIGIKDDALVSSDELTPPLYARYNAYLRARIANNGQMPGVATWRQIGETMHANAAAGVYDDAAEVLDKAIYSMWAMDELASAPALLFNPGEDHQCFANERGGRSDVEQQG